jgi:hypothetical protein
MALWRVTPTWKKSVVEVQEWVKPGSDDIITHEIGWRWGEFFVETEDDNPPKLEEGVDMFNLPDGCICDDWSTEDGCWEESDIEIDDENEYEEVEEFLSENSVYDLEEKGWVLSDSYMYINCELEITKVE